ncbi:hypothetical protein ERO13_1Z050199v2 [Gossypium hirsutum]|nr:hypothetical protein ERO13_1Z050199v2 [Gossypium hirsutum]
MLQRRCLTCSRKHGISSIQRSFSEFKSLII